MGRADLDASPIEPAVHGGAPRGWLDFSANLNPTGVPPAVADAIAHATYDAYGDLDPAPAEARLAAEAGLDRDHVLLTAGAGEALRLVAEAFLGPGSRVLIAGPTYAEYARLAAVRSSEIEEVRATEPDLRPPVDRLVGRLGSGPESARPRVLFVCDPNNPTGARLSPDALVSIVDAVPRDAVLVLDQSFGPFAGPSAPAARLVSTGRVVLIRSLTKALCVPGLRLGYALAQPGLIEALRMWREPWPLGAHAIAAAGVACWDLPEPVREAVRAWRERLSHGLAARGLESLPSETNFLLVRVGPAADRIVESLAADRIAVRSCRSFGLPGHVRIAVRPPDAQERLLASLDRLRAEVSW